MSTVPDDTKPARGRLVRNPFAVALSDACEVFDALPEPLRGLLLDNLESLYRPAPGDRGDAPGGPVT